LEIKNNSMIETLANFLYTNEVSIYMFLIGLGMTIISIILLNRKLLIFSEIIMVVSAIVHIILFF